jgi:hypothetical protein
MFLGAGRIIVPQATNERHRPLVLFWCCEQDMILGTSKLSVLYRYVRPASTPCGKPSESGRRCCESGHRR